ncbi:MAG: hypothetical protein EHM55_23370 [Acidobacteria bacterium]|nr:MAG: hypothetical protein EHM55_23370 [Acidobacteriota bacterium]
MPATLAALVFSVVSVAALSAQGPITNRLPATTMRGTIVEVTCFRQQGAATVASPEQIACAKQRVAADGRLGILTEGDGLFQITGAFAAGKYAKLAPFIGQRVDVTGSEVIISNNYDYRNFEAEKIARVKD